MVKLFIMLEKQNFCILSNGFFRKHNLDNTFTFKKLIKTAKNSGFVFVKHQHNINYYFIYLFVKIINYIKFILKIICKNNNIHNINIFTQFILNLKYCESVKNPKMVDC